MTIYSVKDYQSYRGKVLLNVFWYLGATGGVANDLGNAFISDVLPSILALQDPALTHDRLVVEAFQDIADFTEIAVGAVGTQAAGGDDLPAFIAYGFRLNRTTKLTRHGQKRFGGISEGGVLGDGVPAGLQNAVDTLEAALADSISLVGGDYQPVIMHREKDVNGVYQLTGQTNLVSSAQFTGVTTQNTRKS